MNNFFDLLIGLLKRPNIILKMSEVEESCKSGSALTVSAATGSSNTVRRSVETSHSHISTTTSNCGTSVTDSAYGGSITQSERSGSGSLSSKSQNSSISSIK